MARKKVSFEMSQKIYEEMDQVCERLGLSPEEAFEIFAHKVVNDQEIPFMISEEDYPVDERARLVRHFLYGAEIIAVIGIICSLFSLFHGRKRR